MDLHLGQQNSVPVFLAAVLMDLFSRHTFDPSVSISVSAASVAHHQPLTQHREVASKWNVKGKWGSRCYKNTRQKNWFGSQGTPFDGFCRGENTKSNTRWRYFLLEIIQRSKVTATSDIKFGSVIRALKLREITTSFIYLFKPKSPQNPSLLFGFVLKK